MLRGICGLTTSHSTWTIQNRWSSERIAGAQVFFSSGQMGSSPVHWCDSVINPLSWVASSCKALFPSRAAGAPGKATVARTDTCPVDVARAPAKALAVATVGIPWLYKQALHLTVLSCGVPHQGRAREVTAHSTTGKITTSHIISCTPRRKGASIRPLASAIL